MNSPTEMLSPEKFSEELLNAVAEFPLENTRAYQLMVLRKCPLSFIQEYACSAYRAASFFCEILPQLIEQAPDDKTKLTLLKNLLEEEGIHISPSKGLIIQHEARHTSLALRFVEACGASQLLENNPKNQLSAARDYLSEGRWLEAIAFIMIGLELPFAHNSTLIMNALRGQGYTAKELIFFAVHRDADKRHGQEALDIVINNSHSREQQDAAIQAAQEGARHVFRIHGGVAKTPMHSPHKSIDA